MNGRQWWSAAVAVAVAAGTSVGCVPNPPPPLRVNAVAAVSSDSVTVRGTLCLGSAAEARLERSWPVRVPTDENGAWQAVLPVSTEPYGASSIQARCLDGEQTLFTYPSEPLEVVQYRGVSASGDGRAGSTLVVTPSHPCLTGDGEVRASAVLTFSSAVHPLGETVADARGNWQISVPLDYDIPAGTYYVRGGCTVYDESGQQIGPRTDYYPTEITFSSPP